MKRKIEKGKLLKYPRANNNFVASVQIFLYTYINYVFQLTLTSKFFNFVLTLKRRTDVGSGQAAYFYVASNTECTF